MAAKKTKRTRKAKAQRDTYGAELLTVLQARGADAPSKARARLARAGLELQVATDADLQRLQTLLGWLLTALEHDAEFGDRPFSWDDQEVTASQLWDRVRKALNLFEGQPEPITYRRHEAFEVFKLQLRLFRQEADAGRQCPQAVRHAMLEDLAANAPQQCLSGLVRIDDRFSGLSEADVREALLEVARATRKRGTAARSPKLAFVALCCRAGALGAPETTDAKAIRLVVTAWKSDLRDPSRTRPAR